MAINQGVTVHGEFSSSDASALSEANSRILLYGPGSTTAVPLASTDYFCCTYLKIVVGSALTVTVYDGADATPGAGEVIDKGNYPANGGIVGYAPDSPHVCQPGSWPKVKTSGAGQVDVTIRGYITNITPR